MLTRVKHVVALVRAATPALGVLGVQSAALKAPVLPISIAVKPLAVINAINRRHVREAVKIHIKHVDVVAVRLGHGVVHRVLANLTGSLERINPVLAKEINVCEQNTQNKSQ